MRMRVPETKKFLSANIVENILPVLYRDSGNVAEQYKKTFKFGRSGRYLRTTAVYAGLPFNNQSGRFLLLKVPPHQIRRPESGLVGQALMGIKPRMVNRTLKLVFIF
jgi:hypothetical protein